MTDTLNRSYRGLLLIGDPHLEGRQPGFRKDDYPSVILEKLAWCLDFAGQHQLLPAILGDLFDKPRDNPNWLMTRLINLLTGRGVIGLYGNHDVHYQPELTEHDSLCVLVEAGCLQMISAHTPWCGVMNGRRVVVSGSSYRQEIPEQFDANVFFDTPANHAAERPLVIWLTHHDIMIPGYDEGRIRPREIPGVDLVVNGHIHRRLEDVAVGGTNWITPGNISRRSRSDASRAHVPAVLHVDVSAEGYTLHHVTVPHQRFDEVFHEAVIDTADTGERSAFVAGLAELQARRTAGGAGLMQFLEHNLDQFDADVAAEIRTLAAEVTHE